MNHDMNNWIRANLWLCISRLGRTSG